MTILSFIAIFAGMRLGRMGTDHMAALCLIAGVFSGSMAWWTFLSLITSLFSSRLNAKAMAWINRLSGTVLISFGLLAMSERLYWLAFKSSADLRQTSTRGIYPARIASILLAYYIASLLFGQSPSINWPRATILANNFKTPGSKGSR